MKYRPEIDGLRTLAILPVVFFHAGFTVFSGGYIGVDIFFVISGYLITAMILEDQKTGVFTLVNFYERRARRILPSLFFVMATCIPFAWLFFMPNEMKDFSRSLISVVTFISNIFFWKTTGYFDSAAEIKPLLHTWSLAVEEQFYLIFPALMFAVRRRGNLRLFIFSAIFFVSLITAEANIKNHPLETFFTFHNRAWELLIGSIAACILAEKKLIIHSQIALSSINLVGLILIIIPIFAFNNDTASPGLITLAPTLGAAFIILFESRNSITYRILSSRFFVQIGLISYSLYLWHQPIFAYFRQITGIRSDAFYFSILTIMATCLAYLSWRYVESPFRNNEKFNKKEIFKYSIFGILFFFSFGLIGNYTNGFRQYYVSHRLSDVQIQKYNLITENTGKDLSTQMLDNDQCNYWTNEISSDFQKKFKSCTERLGKAVVVLGDSHAMNIYNVLFKLNHSKFLIGISKPGCRPHGNNKSCHYNDFLRFLELNKNHISYVIYHQSGSYFLKDKYGNVDSSLVFEEDSPISLHSENLNAVIKYIGNISIHSPVHWWGPFVEARVNFNDFRILDKDFLISDVSIRKFDLLDNYIKQANKDNTNFIYFSTVDALRVKSNDLLIDSCITYNDSDHFSACGETFFATRLSTSEIYGKTYKSLSP